jgi:hypothetical protein
VARKRRREGRVVTFYSYKGGVGRTMALANVAFLAATNGYRVLVMDWDLEAPGLPYYFRGLLEAPDARALKESPGILNLVWDWTSSLQRATTAAETQAVFSRFDDPGTFKSYVKTVLDPMEPFEDEGDRGCLDLINAGSPQILTPEPRDYVDALAHFSWPEFFSDYAGGSVLENLRTWAKQNYDFVLIDSRTGLADVSGICTTQMPDAVALCFILNRQNIDGVARVSAAIRNRRQDEIELHAVPMRVSAKGTSEEDDARARGLLELSKTGGFSTEAVTDDFKLLAVRAADNVPYYETLSPVIATDLATDPLTFNYVRLASRLLDTPLELPEISSAWIEIVRRRLQPRHATIEYVTKLTAADAMRAITELETLTESAFDTVVDGGDLSDDYVTALVEASLFLASRGETPFEAVDMLHRTLDLLRALAVANPEKWRGFLGTAIERHIESLNFYLDPEEELALLEELDGLLAESNTVATRLRRLGSRRRAARLYIQRGEFEAAGQTVGECIRLIKEISAGAPKLAADQAEQLFAAEVEAALFRGEIAERQDDWRKAHHELRAGLAQLEQQDLTGRNELGRLAFELHNRLARAPETILPIREAAEHAVEAARFGSQQSAGSLVTQFTELARVIAHARCPDLALAFCEYALDTQDKRGLLQNANYWGRAPRTANAFFSVAADLARVVGATDGPPVQGALILLGETALMVWRTLNRRGHHLTGRHEPLAEPLVGLQGALADAGAPVSLVAALGDLAVEAARGRPRPPPPPAS